MRIYGIETCSIVDGPGVRMAVFVQGCPHHCEGCHNPGSWDFDGGTEMPVEDIIHTMQDLAERKWIDGLTLSGGDPMCQSGDCAKLARAAKKAGLNVWCYTGYTLDRLQEMVNPHVADLLSAIDVLVDGPFILKRRTLELAYRGSSNQRIIYMKEPDDDD